MKIYFTSDFHFGHNKEFIWKARGFNSIEEMNRAYVERWNERVNPEDGGYILGDLMLGDVSNIEYVKQLNGKLHIILGNHDTAVRTELYKTLPNVLSVEYATLLNYRKYHFFLSHFPSLTGNLEKESLRQCTCNLFGHTHQTTNFYNEMPFMYHVGVDSHNGYPVEIEEIIAEMKKKYADCIQYL